MQAIIKAIILFVICLTFKVYGQNTYDFNKILSSYLAIQNERLHFNGVVLVANQDTILFQKAIGLSSQEDLAPLSLDSKFKIASISKSFTGALIAIAESEGKLKLDDNIDQYFPKNTLKKGWEQITIKHLISHTSGIPHWKGYKDYWTVKSKKALNKEQVLNDVFTMDLLFAPGEQVNYSSPAYFILASILEEVYKTSYREILNKKILKALKLKNTGAFNETDVISNMASGYHLLPNDSLIPAPYRNMSALKGAGSLYANAKDLLRWNRSMLDGTTWNTELTKAIFTKTTGKPMPHNSNSFYGMGWYMHEGLKGRPKSYQVAGGTYGYSSISVIYPDEKLSIIVLSNVSFLPVNNIWSDIENIVLNKPFKLPEIIQSKVVSIENLEELAGTYMANNGMKLKVFIYGGKLFVKLGKNPPLQIVSEKELVFSAKKINIKFTFKKGLENKIEGLTTEGRGEKYDFKKIAE